VTVTEGNTISAIDLASGFSDTDNDMLTLELKSPLPPGLDFDATTQKITGVVGANDPCTPIASSYKVIILANDGHNPPVTNDSLVINIKPKTEVFHVALKANTNDQKNPVEQQLTPGTYQVSYERDPKTGEPSASRTRVRPRGCDGAGKNCARGWENRFYYKGIGKTKRISDYLLDNKACTNPQASNRACRYESPELAFANAPKPFPLTVKDGCKTARFYIFYSPGLSNLDKRLGGIFLKLEKISTD
jgi:hypothetical protein